MTTIKEIEKEIKELLIDLDNYGYSREETLEELNKGFNSEIQEEVVFKYWELKAKLQTKKEDLEIIESLDYFGRDDIREELIKLIEGKQEGGE